jgi:phosphoribosyl-AMP cyclohydrolase
VSANLQYIDLLSKDLKFDQDGLLPVVVQEVNTREVLMLAYANLEAIEKYPYW